MREQQHECVLLLRSRSDDGVLRGDSPAEEKTESLEILTCEAYADRSPASIVASLLHDVKIVPALNVHRTFATTDHTTLIENVDAA